MVYMTRCCCCWNTREGSIATGIYFMIGKIIEIVILIGLLASPNILKKQAKEYGLDSVSYLRNFCIALLVLGFIFLLFCALLIYGAVKDRRGFLLPWVIAMSVQVAIQIIATILFIVVVAKASQISNVPLVVCIILSMLFNIAFTIYCLLCVMSQYQLLGQSSSNPPPYAAKM